MANTIRIPRSVSTNTPSSLAQGELAFSESGSPNGIGELFIGVAGPGVQKIATLTGASAAEPNDTAQDNQTITTGLGIDGAEAGDSGNITISFDPNELTAVAPANTDWIVFEDSTDSAPKKALLSTFPLSLFDNDLASYVEVDTLASVTGRGATTAVASTFSGGILLADSDLNRPVLEDYAVKHQAPTVSANAVTVNCTLGNSVLIDMDPATAAVALTLSNPPASGRYGEVTLTIVMGTPAYDMTWPGSITWQGGSAPVLSTINDTVDLVHLYTVDGGTNWYGTFALAAATVVVTSFTTGTGLIDTGSVSAPIVAIDYVGTDNFIDSATNLEGTAIASGDTLIYHDATDDTVKKGFVSDLPFAAGTGDITRVDITAGLGLTGDLNTLTGDHIQTIDIVAGVGLIATAGSLDLDFSELTDMVGAIAGTTEFILQDGTTESRKAASEIGLQFFDNAVSEFVSENDTLVVVDWNWVLDEDAMGSDSATHLATQQSIKAYIDTATTGALTHKGGYNASTNSPALDTGSPVLVVGDMYTVTVAGTFFTVEVEIGDVLISDVDSVDAAALSDWTIVQSNIGAASETVPGYIELATQAEMDTATDDLRAVTPLKYANSTIDGGTF